MQCVQNLQIVMRMQCDGLYLFSCITHIPAISRVTLLVPRVTDCSGVALHPLPALFPHLPVTSVQRFLTLQQREQPERDRRSVTAAMTAGTNLRGLVCSSFLKRGKSANEYQRYQPHSSQFFPPFSFRKLHLCVENISKWFARDSDIHTCGCLGSKHRTIEVPRFSTFPLRLA